MATIVTRKRKDGCVSWTACKAIAKTMAAALAKAPCIGVPSM